MKSKRILFISPLPPPNYGSALSSEMCLNILRESGQFDVTNIKINYSKEMSDIGKLNLDKITGFFNVVRQIRESIKQLNPELVYLVPATSGAGLIRDYFLFKSIKKNYNGKIVLHIRSRMAEESWKSPLFSRMYKAMLRDSCVIVLGDSLVQDLHGNVDPNNIFVLPNAIKNEVSEKEIKKVFSSRAKKEGSGVLFLSNMDKSKGWMKLLEACSMLNNKNINFKCSFAGAWPSIKEESEFLSYVKENGLSEVVSYVGKVDSVDKNILLKKSNILVFPTEYKLETFGRVIIEGMMFGLPVIANSIATIPSIIEHRRTGLLLENNTPKEIADCIEYLLKNPKIAISMGIAGRKRFLDKFEISEYKKSFINIINRIK